MLTHLLCNIEIEYDLSLRNCSIESLKTLVPRTIFKNEYIAGKTENDIFKNLFFANSFKIQKYLFIKDLICKYEFVLIIIVIKIINKIHYQYLFLWYVPKFKRPGLLEI